VEKDVIVVCWRYAQLSWQVVHFIILLVMGPLVKFSIKSLGTSQCLASGHLLGPWCLSRYCWL